MVTPGRLGQNTVTSGAVMSPDYAIDTLNSVIDVGGRLSARAGTTTLTTTPITGVPAIQSVFEYNAGGGTYIPILSYAGGISDNITNPSANQINGAVNVTSGVWFWQNFNNKLIGLQNGFAPIVWTGTGNAAYVVPSSGTAPIGGVGCAAFGRLWVVDADLQTIKYCALLDETNWGAGDSGIIDMHTIWSNGTDQVTAIFPFNAALIVCGLKHIIMFTDGRGSLLGMDPTQAYVFDMLTGTGVVSQASVVPIGEADVFFLSPNGVQSLARLQQARNNPLATLTKYVRDTFLAQLDTEVQSLCTATYNPLYGFYLIGLPNSKVVWCLDVRRMYNDEVGDQCAICTYWNMEATALYTNHLYTTFIGRTPGQLAEYGGVQDEGVTFNWNWLSPWLRFDPQISTHLKLLKRIQAILFTGGNTTLTITWNTDFGAGTGNTTYTLPASSAIAQYGIAQYGIDQYSGGGALSLILVPAHGRGQYYQLQIGASVAGTLALAQVQMAAKIGRIA
jgi:hypothetical protein